MPQPMQSPNRQQNRFPQPVGTKGSLAWMQRLVNTYPDMLGAVLASSTGINPQDLTWVSPLATDDHAEYRDGGFLQRIGVTLPSVPLHDFWPKRGPQWDALARTGSGCLLVEAKAHLGELRSNCAAGPSSLARIQQSFGAVKRFLGIDDDADWLTPYYQYANRLAHLYLLRELNGIDAELVMLCFVNDRAVGGPSTEQEWVEALDEVHRHLAIPDHPLLRHVHHVFMDVRSVQSASDQTSAL